MLTSHFLYRVGGALTWNDPTYIERSADTELAQALRTGTFAYVLAPRQMGKSSLRIRTRYQLTQQGYQCVTIQATQLMDHHMYISHYTPDAADSHRQNRWCAALISIIWSELNIGEMSSLLAWLASTSQMDASERLNKFTQEVLATAVGSSPTVIFIDEIDALIGTACQDDLFDWIERCYQLRQIDTAYENLQFAVFGRAVASDLCLSSQLLKTAQAVELRPFSLIETYYLHQGFENTFNTPNIVLKAIYKWAGGQPFLTQKLCSIATELIGSLVQPSDQPIVLSTRTVDSWVEGLVRSHIIENWQTQDHPVHFKDIFNHLTCSPYHESLLSLYQTIHSGGCVYRCQDRLQAELLLTGIVVENNNCLQVANKIYQQIFTHSTCYLAEMQRAC
ncbi:MAG: AAA-like domain-containing protein [Cyanobacteria bacterium J06560_6]